MKENPAIQFAPRRGDQALSGSATGRGTRLPASTLALLPTNVRTRTDQPRLHTHARRPAPTARNHEDGLANNTTPTSSARRARALPTTLLPRARWANPSRSPSPTQISTGWRTTKNSPLPPPDATVATVLQLMTTLDRRFMAGLAYFLGARALGMGVVRVGNGIPELQWDTLRRIEPTCGMVVPSFPDQAHRVCRKKQPRPPPLLPAPMHLYRRVAAQQRLLAQHPRTAYCRQVA